MLTSALGRLVHRRCFAHPPRAFRPILPAHRSFCSGSKGAAQKWLAAKGYQDERLVRGILDAFGGNPSVGDLSSLGDAGLRAVADAVCKEVAGRKSSKPIQVFVGLPNSASELVVEAFEGETFFDLYQRNRDISQHMECSCRGIAACSTCHVYVDPAFADKLPPPQDAELDMLDLAWGCNERSRLGCQIRLNETLDGLRVELPAQVHDLFK